MFQEILSRNLNSVLQRTPFELKEIKTLQSLRSSVLPSSIKSTLPTDRPASIQANSNTTNSSGHFKSNLVSSMAAISLNSKENSFPFTLEPNSTAESVVTETTLPNETLKNLDPFGDEMLLPSAIEPMKLSPSADYLSISPNFDPNSLSFDNQSFDESTPDEFAPINFIKGISNINYDFTFSDNSAENSISEDIGEMHASRSNAESICGAVKASDSISSFNLDEFDPLRGADCSSVQSAPMPSQSQSKQLNINLPEPKPTTLIESEDSPNQVLLPSPLKPMATDYKGFSNSNIPTISCNTGDFSSINHSDVNNQPS